MTDSADLKVGVVVFDVAEELDFVGPWEVLTSAATLGGLEVFSVAERGEPVRCAKGLRVLPDRTFADVDALDVVLVPGGQGSRQEMKNPAMLDWLGRIAPGCQWVTSVCTGAAIVGAAGLLAGCRATTHWAYIETLRKDHPDVEVLEKVRYVRDGRVVTAAGVSAGIDMALWLVGQIKDPATARKIQHYIEYDPAPPYAAEV
jgi:transcriptional regulator GlxA family with amidase domain